MRALEYQNLYQSSKLAGAERSEYLQMAAQEYYHGRAAMMLASPADRDEVHAKLRELAQAASNVHDEASLSQYFLTHNQVESGSHKTEVEGLVEPNHNAGKLGIIYMVLYGIGTCVVLTGQALD
jgi:hypothetical protein